jgi:DNA-binding transcriptional ArsR family regulator
VAAATPLALVDEPERLRLALSPLRRRLLERLAEPASATELAGELGLSRQQVNYHVRQLEAAGLVRLVEERPRRGCTERVLQAAARSFLVDPAVLSAPAGLPSPHQLDRFAADHLVGTAADVVRQVSRMRDRAAQAGQRLLTFTLEADVGLAAPADVERLADALAEAVTAVAARFEAPDGRRYRLVVGAHPTPAPPDRQREEEFRDARSRVR